MSMNIKKVTMAAAAAVLLLTSACSSSGNSAGGSSSSPAASPAASAASGKKVEISFTDVSPSPEREKFFNDIIASFQKENPNITVKLETVPWDQAFNKLSTQGATHTLPDVVNMYPAWLATFVPAGYVEPISSQYDKWQNKDKLSAFVKNITMEEQQRKIYKDIYMIPDAIMAGGLFVRTDWFKEANLQMPTTWDQVFEDAQKLTDPSKKRYGWAYRGARAGFDQIFNYISSKTNGQTYLPDGTSVLSKPEAVEAFKKFTDIYKKGWAPKDSINWGYKEMVQGFTSGVTGILNQTTEVVATAQQSLKDGTWTVIPYPKGDDGKRYVNAGSSWGYSISKDSKNKDAAWKFIEYLSTPENNLKYSKALTMIPIMKDAANDPEFGKGPMKGFIDMLNDKDTAVLASFGSFPELGQFRESFMDAEVQKYLLDKQSAEETMKNLADFLTKAQQKYMKEHPEVPVPQPIKP